MKKLHWILTILLIYSCSEDDGTTDNNLEEKWKLTEATCFCYFPDDEVSYSFIKE